MSKRNTPNNPFDPSRRRLLSGMAAAGAGGLIASSCSSSNSSTTLPDPAASGIDHIIVVMMENRSFDSVLGWVPGADGMQDGLSFTDTNSKSWPTFALSGTAYGYQGCGFADPDHSYDGGRTQFNGGAMDGFLQTQPADDQFPIGYYGRDDVQFFAGAADQWTICDAYHCGILSCTLPNRMYMHTGQTDRISNTFAICQLPTIWDSLMAKNAQDSTVTSRYYYADTPVIALFKNFSAYKDAGMVGTLSQFAKDFASGGTPPSVSYVDPYMGLAIGEGLGTSWDDHAFADIRNGQCFMNYIYNVVRASPVWDKTLLVFNYDEWGGFYDHVAPAMAPIGDADTAAGNDGRLGFRVPCIAIGPRARRGYVAHTPLDPNSILNMICWRFGMDKLGVRGNSVNFANILDFGSAPDTSSAAITVEYDGSTGPLPTSAPFTPPLYTSLAKNVFGGMCGTSSASAENLRRFEQHYAEVRIIQALGRQGGLQI